MSRLGNDKFSPSVAFLTKIFIYCNLCLPVDMMTSSCQDWCTIFKLVPNIHEKEAFIFLPDVLYHLCSNHPGIIKPHQYCHEIEIKRSIVIIIHHHIHSKSESRDPNGAAKKLNFPQFFSKNATKWPKNDPKFPKVAQI